MKRLIFFVMFLLVPIATWAQPFPGSFAYHNLDTRVDGKPIVIVAFTGTGAAANVNGSNTLSWRLDVTDIANPTLTPVQCAEADFRRADTSFRAGPILAGMADDLTVVGDDESEAGNTTAILQLASREASGTIIPGRCFPYLYPGSDHTWFTGISRAGGRVAGHFVNAFAAPGQGGRTREHGFLIDYTVSLVGGVEQVTWGTPILLDGPGATTRNYPTACNSNGVCVGYSEVNIQPDNTSTYAAWLRWPDGTYEVLTVPNGQPTCPVALNDTPIVLLTEQRCNVNGGPAWWYDVTTHTHYPLPMPTPDTTTLAPTALTSPPPDADPADKNKVAFAGFYTRRIDTGLPEPGNFRFEFHGFIALPDVAPTPTGPPADEPPASKEKPPKEKKGEKPEKDGRGPKSGK